MKVSLWIEDAIAAAALFALIALCPLVLSLEQEPSLVARATDDNAWYRRHERNSADCRGQQYISQCCTDARHDLACIDAEIKEPQ